MFEKIKFHNNIKNNFLIKEYKNLHNKYVMYSDIKYMRENRFLKQFVIKDNRDGNIFFINKDVVSDFNKYKNITYLKVKELNRVRNERDLIPIFITLTLPSKYHPFTMTKNKQYNLNKNFDFIEIEERVSKGYKFLNNVYRELYKNIKKDKNKNMQFVKIIEPHKSLVPHLHRIFYIDRKTFKSVEKKFNKIVKKYELKQTKLEQVKERQRSSYIIKYLLKNFENDELKKLDGWKKLHKIRLFSMSNLELPTGIFKKLYYSNKEHNIKILKEIKEGKSKYNNLYEYYTKNTTIKIVKYHKQDNFKEVIIKNDKKGNKFKYGKFIVVDEVEKFTKKDELYKQVEINQNRIRDFYYKYIKYEDYFSYEINKKIETDFFNDEKFFYIVDIYKKSYEIEKTKSYKLQDYKIYDNELQKMIIEKNNFEFDRVPDYI
jgi:hypothetical protein